MHDMQRAAIVRRVYRAGSTPRLGALVPEYVTDEDDGNSNMTLVYIELPYMEDVRDFDFGPVYTDEVRPSEEQVRMAALLC